MLKILQARLQQYMNRELPDVQAGFRKGRGTRNQIVNICWIMEKARVSEKYLFLLYWLCQSLWLCGSQPTVENSERDGNTRPPDLYGCESLTIKKTELRRMDAFKLWCWRRLLRVPWTSRKSNQSILKEINPEYTLEGLMLKLKVHYFGHLMQRANSLQKTLILGKTEGRRRRERQREDEMVR